MSLWGHNDILNFSSGFDNSGIRKYRLKIEIYKWKEGYVMLSYVLINYGILIK